MTSARWALVSFSRFVRNTQLAITRRPKTVLVAAALTFIASLGPAGKLKTLIVIDDLIDPDFKTYSAMMDLHRDFPNKNNLLLMIKTKNPGEMPTSSELCDLMGWVNQVRFELTGIDKIYSTFGIQIASEKNHNIHFTPVLRNDCGAYSDDIKEAPAVQREMNQISKSAFGAFLSSKNADDILFTFYLQDQTKRSRFGQFDYQMVDKLRDHLETNYLQKHPHLEAVWGGMGTYQYFLKQGYDESMVLNCIAALLTLLLFRLIYGTWKSGLLFQWTLMLSLFAVYGVMGLLDWPIDNLSNVLPTLLMVATLEDFIFLSHFRKTFGMSTKQALRKLMIPSFFTSLSTAIGFGSLYTSHLSILRRFGVECALGAMFEWVAVITLIPALIQVFPRMDRWVTTKHNRIDRFAEKINEVKPRRWLAIASLSVFVFSLLFHSHLNINDAPEEIFSDSHPFSKAIQYLRSSRGWGSEISLVFNHYSHEKVNREILEKIRKSDPLVAAIEDPYATRDELMGDLPTDHRTILQDAWASSPLSSRLVSGDVDRARALLFLRSTDIVQVNALRARIESVCHEECHLAGSLNSYGEFGDQVLSTLLSSLGMSLLQVAILLMILCLALTQRFGFQFIFSSLWGVFALLCFYIIFQIKVFFITSVIASVMVGMAGDNPIQFLFFKKRNREMSDSIKKLAPASFSLVFFMSAVTAVLFLSHLSFLRTLAALVILGLGLMYLGDVFLLKTLLKSKEEGT